MHGHNVRRWNYPANYRVPARMPGKVRDAIREMESDNTSRSRVPALARELESRCQDFRKIDALYATSIDDTHPAHTYWPEAYLGLIETADWLRLEADQSPFHWARQICPGPLVRMSRGLPTGKGLSQSFQGSNCAPTRRPASTGVTFRIAKADSLNRPG